MLWKAGTNDPSAYYRDDDEGDDLQTYETAFEIDKNLIFNNFLRFSSRRHKKLFLFFCTSLSL